MATTAEQIALGNDLAFRARVRTLMLAEAGVVYSEDPQTPNHTVRANFASKIMQTPGLAEGFAPAIATRTNIAASTVTYNFDPQRVETSATDAEIRSQIATDWNMFAGV